jgi:transposase
MSPVIIGIDIAKKKFDIAMLKENKFYSKVFENKEEGYIKLVEWLKQEEVAQIAMEATSSYWEALAEYLYKCGYKVSVVNPSAISAYSASKLSRNKTDKQDAKMIASYCLSHNPELWKPTPEAVKKLQALVRRLESLQHMQQEEKNRLASGINQAEVVKSLSQSIEFFQAQIDELKKLIQEHINNNPELKQQKELLVSIPGIADTTAANILAELVNIDNYSSARQVAAYAGLTPRHRTSGSSVRGKPMLSKIGNSRLRKILYFPAVVAKTYNPILSTFALKLAQSGKHTMVVIGALMRKLLHIIFGVLKSGRPFDPYFLLQPS